MSQLGKRKGRAGNRSATRDRRDRDQQEAGESSPWQGYQKLSEDLTDSEDETLRSSERCLYAVSEPEVSDSLLENDSVPPSSESEYYPTPEKRRRVAIMQQPVEAASLGRVMFVCLSSQVSAFLDQVNANMACRTQGCSGVYVPVRVVYEGLGGGLKVEIACMVARYED